MPWWTTDSLQTAVPRRGGGNTQLQPKGARGPEHTCLPPGLGQPSQVGPRARSAPWWRSLAVGSCRRGRGQQGEPAPLFSRESMRPGLWGAPWGRGVHRGWQLAKEAPGQVQLRGQQSQQAAAFSLTADHLRPPAPSALLPFPPGRGSWPHPIQGELQGLLGPLQGPAHHSLPRLSAWCRWSGRGVLAGRVSRPAHLQAVGGLVQAVIAVWLLCLSSPGPVAGVGTGLRGAESPVRGLRGLVPAPGPSSLTSGRPSFH